MREVLYLKQIQGIVLENKLASSEVFSKLEQKYSSTYYQS